MRFPSFKWLLAGFIAVSPAAAADLPMPRFDPPDQLFRRAPMAQSARSIVVNITTNLHLAFDAEKCRVHTVWQGRGLELWGPPYHGGKTPFIATIAGTNLWEFPGLVSWSTAPGMEAEVNFSGYSVDQGALTFRYTVTTDGAAVEVEERPFLLAREGEIIFVRELQIGPSTAGLRFLAHAALHAEAELVDRGVHIRSAGDSQHLWSEGTGPAGWEVTMEQVDYSYEQVTNEGTEQGNPVIHRKGIEARAYLRFPPRSEPTKVSVYTAVHPSTHKLADIDQLSRAESRSRQPKTYKAGKDRRADGGDDWFRIEYFPVPPEIELLVTGMAWLSARDLLISTWLGEIYVVEDAVGDPGAARYRRFAQGLNEPLGLAVHDDEIYVVQKGELTRIQDTNDDGIADLFECVNDSWGYSGNYHSYSFGPVIDPAGNFHLFTTGQRARWDLPYQGYVLQVSPDGREVKPLAHGLRAPNGFGLYKDDLFFVDNQGNWVGACKLSQVIPRGFHGFPSSSPAPRHFDPMAQEVQLPAVWFPRELAPSSSGMATISDERFGPFHGQLLVGDFQNAIVTRVYLEKVQGRWQGAVFPFARNFLSGVNRLTMGPVGRLYVGGVKRTWSAAAPNEYSLDRVSFTGNTPFEVKEVRALPGGFELEFTKPVSRLDAEDVENYAISQFAYEYHQEYGSPRFNHEGKPGRSEITIRSAVVAGDERTVRLVMDGLRPGFVTHFQLPLITSAEGEDVRQEEFWYTLNAVPER